MQIETWGTTVRRPFRNQSCIYCLNYENFELIIALYYIQLTVLTKHTTDLLL